MQSVDADTLRRAFDALGDAIVVFHGDTPTAANAAGERLVDPAALAARAAAAAPAPLVERTEEGRYLEVRLSDLGHGGQGRILVARDVTEREALRAQLTREGQLLSLAAHELKGPLHVLGMACHLMETRAARRQPVDDTAIERLRRQVVRLDRIINELLDAARAQEGRLVIDDAEEIDLASIVRDQVDQTVRGPLPGHPARAREADVSVEIPASAPVRGDRVRLAELVHQLVDNALRFTPVGTPVRVALRPRDGAFELRISDQGPGIPEAERPALFTRGTGRDRARGGQGLGLGLFVAGHVARLHGGALAHEPGLPAGSTFVLTLPSAHR